jgi:hypothetical protein
MLTANLDLARANSAAGQIDATDSVDVVIGPPDAV